MAVRTRFAPSPTGYLHIGGARTALFNHLYARHHDGVFVLRVEDTDRKRSTPEAIAAILDGLAWLGLDADEGPVFQTERLDLYRERADALLAAGHAYRCWCTPEELESRRGAAVVQGRSPAYDRTCRSRTAPPPGRDAHVVRFHTPLDGATRVEDLVKGAVVFQHAELDDFILLRSDGSPTFLFAGVVDDVDMHMTHVIRGDDHLANTPRQIQIYRALEAPLPAFAHLPLILGLDKTRLSKRHGATSVTAYRDMGYLPDALVNYLARLGWSHGDQELFTRAELVEHFTLDTVGLSAGVFDPGKLEWVNFQHLKETDPATLAQLVVPHLERAGLPVPADHAWLGRVVGSLRERAKTLEELAAQARYFLVDDVELEPAAAAKQLTPTVVPLLGDLRARLAALETFDEPTIEHAFHDAVAVHGVKLGKLAQPVRVAVTGGTASPGIFEVLALVGRERTLRRLDAAIADAERRATSEQP
jgi:glutamyl-tRNA synthetase